MDDLISRQAAIDAVNKICDRCGEHKKYNGVMCGTCYLDGVADDIEDLPSAHPDTRKATWAIHTYMPHNYYCTNCKQDSPYNKIWDFCPHCGFKMEDYV